MNLFLVCLGIFCARIIDVSIGVIRTIVMVKGGTKKAAILAFIEVLIWYVAAREALNTNITSIWIAISYAGGYATGTYIGSLLSKIFIKGTTTVQIITKRATKENIAKIRQAGFAISVIEMVDDYDGKPKKMLMCEVNNQKVKELSNLIRNFDKEAFIIANETKMVQNGYIK